MHKKNQAFIFKIKKIITSYHIIYFFVILFLSVLAFLQHMDIQNRLRDLNDPEIKFDFGEVDCGCELNQIDYKKKEDSQKKLISSKSSKYYYPQSCPFANRIKEKNRIYYQNEKEAKSAGKTYYDKCD